MRCRCLTRYLHWYRLIKKAWLWKATWDLRDNRGQKLIPVVSQMSDTISTRQTCVVVTVFKQPSRNEWHQTPQCVARLPNMISKRQTHRVRVLQLCNSTEKNEWHKTPLCKICVAHGQKHDIDMIDTQCQMATALKQRNEWHQSCLWMIFVAH